MDAVGPDLLFLLRDITADNSVSEVSTQEMVLREVKGF